MFLKIEDLSVSQFMTAYPISVEFNVSFKTVVDFMSERGFGNLVVMEEGKPTGVFTEREVLRQIVTNNAPISTYSSWPLIKSEHTVNAKGVARIMAANNIKRLGITYEKDLIGIITAIDLIDAYQKGSRSSHISHWNEVK